MRDIDMLLMSDFEVACMGPSSSRTRAEAVLRFVAFAPPGW